MSTTDAVGWTPMTREGFEASRTLRGANVVGDPGIRERSVPVFRTVHE